MNFIFVNKVLILRAGEAPARLDLRYSNAPNFAALAKVDRTATGAFPRAFRVLLR